MGITHNPASENVSYCEDGGTWYLNNSPVASFIGSSSYRKEAVPAGRKIVWDLGQHILNNPNNFSYNIIEANYWQGKIAYILANGQISAYRYSRPFYDTGQPTLENCYPGNNSGFRARLSNGQITGTFNHLYNELVTQEIYPNGSGNCSYHQIQRAKKGTGFIPSNNPDRLQIFDGNQEFIYNINNSNSVSVQDLNSNDSKFTFFVGSEFQVTASTNSIVSVSCNCPPNTMDCGDCCLPCDEIFNSISGIRELISQLK